MGSLDFSALLKGTIEKYNDLFPSEIENPIDILEYVRLYLMDDVVDIIKGYIGISSKMINNIVSEYIGTGDLNIVDNRNPLNTAKLRFYVPMIGAIFVTIEYDDIDSMTRISEKVKYQRARMWSCDTNNFMSETWSVGIMNFKDTTKISRIAGTLEDNNQIDFLISLSTRPHITINL